MPNFLRLLRSEKYYARSWLVYNTKYIKKAIIAVPIGTITSSHLPGENISKIAETAAVIRERIREVLSSRGSENPGKYTPMNVYVMNEQINATAKKNNEPSTVLLLSTNLMFITCFRIAYQNWMRLYPANIIIVIPAIGK